MTPAATYTAALRSVLKRPKYGNVRVTVDGVTHDSRREARRWTELQSLQRAGKISELRRQVRFPIEINGQVVCNYIADAAYRENGALVVEDTKSAATSKDKVFVLKRKLMAAVHGIKVRIV